jgi:hypothetical protein
MGVPVLEKRHMFLDKKSGQWRAGKVRGLTGLDFARCVDSMAEFEEFLLAPWRSGKSSGQESPGKPLPDNGR